MAAAPSTTPTPSAPLPRAHEPRTREQAAEPPRPADAAAHHLTDVTVLDFPWGLPGFPDTRRMALSELDGDAAQDSALRLLVDLDRPSARFLVVPPGVCFPDHEVDLDDASAARLGLASAEEALVLVVLNVTDEEVTANLLGPVVVNTRTRTGLQAVLADGDLSTRTPLPQRA